MTIFNDDNDPGIGDFASVLLAGEIIAEHERSNQVPTEDLEPLIPDDDREQWEKE